MRVLIDPAGALFSALDLAGALDLTLGEGSDAAGKLVRRVYPEPFAGLGVDIDGYEVTAGFAERWLTADEVEALAARAGSPYSRELTFWAHDIAMQHRGLGIVDAAVPTLVAREEIAEDYSGTYAVHQAARELSQCLGRAIGRQTHFLRLGDPQGRIRWIERQDGVWKPTEGARRDRLLVVKPNHQVPGRGQYPQIRVTAAGLDALTELLVDRPAPTLLDDLS